MKKNTHLPIQEIKFHCISCNADYITLAVIEKNEKTFKQINNCSNCNSFYTGSSSSETKIGSIEKFREREKKLKLNK